MGWRPICFGGFQAQLAHLGGRAGCGRANSDLTGVPPPTPPPSPPTHKIANPHCGGQWTPWKQGKSSSFPPIPLYPPPFPSYGSQRWTAATRGGLPQWRWTAAAEVDCCKEPKEPKGTQGALFPLCGPCTSHPPFPLPLSPIPLYPMFSPPLCKEPQGPLFPAAANSEELLT